MVATLAYALLAVDAQRRMLVANAIAVAVMLTLTPVLAHAHGAVGAAIGAVVTEWVLVVAYAIALARERPDLRLNLHDLPRIVLAAAVALVPVFVLSLPALVETLIALAIFGGLALAFRVIPDEAFDLLPRRLRPRRLR
jgi:O-antigen/teichoic acid export membrane protein